MYHSMLLMSMIAIKKDLHLRGKEKQSPSYPSCLPSSKCYDLSSVLSRKLYNKQSRLGNINGRVRESIEESENQWASWKSNERVKKY